MDKRLKKKWLKALRSGEYIKGEGALCKVNGERDAPAEVTYCCLGVLYEIVNGEDAWVTTRHDYTSYYHLKTKQRNKGTYGAHLIGMEHMTKLISINDHSATFKLVIAYIETHL